MQSNNDKRGRKTKVTLEVSIKAKREKVLTDCLVSKVLLTKGVNKERLKISLQ